jgi:hypothetical protein
MPKSRKPKSTVARWLQKPEFKAAAAKEHQELMLSELVLAIMADDSKSVRALAEELGLSSGLSLDRAENHA